ncbi:Mth938-like domain-containing protein [Sphingomonas sp. R86521]|uniref:Mth938-like domain-containing protein n=1 Tax=Sphingomonas sp. R86521 TaxID=3093860 RepID=UPI0036D309B0
MDREKTDGPIISAFGHGGFKVDDGYYAALLMTPERADGWVPPALSALTEADVAALFVLDPAPEFVLLGTGATLRHPPLAFRKAMEARGIGIEAMDSRAAARAWSVLRGEGRWIAGALYPFAD